MCGMNVVISQALATGLPVITTRHSGLPEQVQDGKNGLLVNEGDWKELAEKITYMIEHPEIWPEMGRNGRGHIALHYNSKTLIEKQIGFYKEVISAK